MAPEVDGNRETGDVRWMHLDVHSQRGDRASEALRPDAEAVHAAQQLTLQLFEVRTDITDRQRAEDGFLRKQRGTLEGSSHADVDDDRRGRIIPRPLNQGVVY